MADDDWRARRAAELLGTPFERPSGPARSMSGGGDATLPISRPAAVPPRRQPIAPAPQLTARTTVPSYRVRPRSGGRRIATWAAVILIVLVCAIGLLLTARRHQPEPLVARPAATAPVVSTPQPQSAPATLAPPVAVTPTTSSPEATIATPAGSATAAAVRPKRPTSHGTVAKPPTKKAEPHRHAAAAKRKSPSGHRSNRIKAPAVAAGSPATAPAAIVATIRAAPVLPICQPDDYSRAPRPCRPSRLRDVRKPFFEN